MPSPMKGRLIHHYCLESLLGEGGMGTVYQAIDTQLERTVAVKMLHPHLVSQTSFMERFRNEALILARLNHPNIAVVYNFLQDGPDYFMAMEFVEGDSLEALIRKAGALPPPVAAEIVRQGLEGLAHAHRKNILHRDIKPANLMLTPEGTVKLMDFGIARVVGDQRLTQVNRIVGTLEYMAPELVQGEAPSAASDIYAMGILLYELLSGKLPFASRTDYALMQAIVQEKPIALRKLNPQIPKELEAIVHKALDKSPARRFSDAKAFQKALQPYYSKLSILDPSRLAPSATAPATDVWTIQPVRRTVLADTSVTPAVNGPHRLHPLLRWTADNWQTVLAGGLTLAALTFISLIIFDQTDKPQTIADQTQVIVPKQSVKPKRQQPETSADQQPTNVVFAQETPITRSLPQPAPSTQPKTADPAPVDKKEQAPQPKTALPKPYGAGPVAVRKSGVSSPTTPVEPPVPATPATRSDNVAEPVAPKTATRKAITIRRLRVSLALVDGLSSDASQEGQSVRFRVTEPVMSDDGEVVIQSGAMAYGEVSRIKRADGELFRKRSLLEFRINSVEAVNGKRIALRSATISDEAKGQAVVFHPGQTFEVRTGDEVLTF